MQFEVENSVNLLEDASGIPALGGGGGVGEQGEDAQLSVAVIVRAVKRANEPLMDELKNVKKQVMFLC